ncbi:MAG: galactose oxidase [Verrucomicrobiales bacterium]|nr:galactose oxidase [Verrucomicrobiales bacterium]
MKKLLTLATLSISMLHAAADAPTWTALPPLPDPEGFAGSFAGVVKDQLIVAGGANFPGAKPWEGGQKGWYDKIFRLDQPNGTWQVVGQLPRPLGYGVSITAPEGLVCIGGSDATQHHAEVFLLHEYEGKLEAKNLPPLPRPCANSCGALVGRTIIVAGGLERPDATLALHTVWALDLDQLEAGWKDLPPWPGQPRMLAAAGVLDGAFYLVGGAALRPDAEGKAERVWLRDGFRFSPDQGWRAIAETPQISVAAPTPMPTLRDSLLLLIGGDDGTQLTVTPDQHRGFPKTVFAYDPATDAWSPQREIPLGLVTTPTAIWRGRVIIPGGEKRPGTRSTEVWSSPLR